MSAKRNPAGPKKAEMSVLLGANGCGGIVAFDAWLPAQAQHPQAYVSTRVAWQDRGVRGGSSSLPSDRRGGCAEIASAVTAWQEGECATMAAAAAVAAVGRQEGGVQQWQ